MHARNPNKSTRRIKDWQRLQRILDERLDRLVQFLFFIAMKEAALIAKNKKKTKQEKKSKEYRNYFVGNYYWIDICRLFLYYML